MADPADDHQLLKAYLAGSPEAFTELVQRHTPLIYSAALRQTRDPHMADDITQAVFLLLSQKARRLSQSTILSAWLYRTTRFAVLDAIKKQRRRQHHEAAAALSQSATIESDPWTEISPLLDDAMNHLREKDRTAILLRYFQNKSLHDVGTTLGTTQAAAGQRINRAIDRLRDFFSRRNITIPAATLSTTLARHAIAPAPSHLLLPTLASPAAANIAKGAATMMFWTKTKLTTIAAIIILAVSIPPLLLETKAQSPTNPPPKIARSSTSAHPIQVDLSNGASLELPCLVGSGDASGKVWSPDGTLLDPPPLQVMVDPKMLAGIHLESDQHIVLFPIRFQQPSKTPATFFMSAGNNGGVVGKVIRDGKPVKDTWVWAETFDKLQTTARAHIRMELDPWQLLATWDSHANNTDMTTDDPHFQVQPAMPALRNGELFVPITIAYPDLEWDDRLFAVLKDGTCRQAESRDSIRRIGTLNVETWSFPADKLLNPDDITQYEFELTPLTHVTISNISLFPNQLTRPTVKVNPLPALFKPKPSLNQPGGL